MLLHRSWVIHLEAEINKSNQLNNFFENVQVGVLHIAIAFFFAINDPYIQ